MKFPFAILSVYILVLYPGTRVFLNHFPWVSEYVYDIFLTGTLFYLLRIKKTPVADLGVTFRHGRQNLLVGGLAGGLVLLSLPVLDGLVALSGLEQTELLTTATVRPRTIIDPWLSIVPVLLHATMEQTFYCGFVVQALLKKYNPFLVIYASGIVFTLLHFTFNLGTFAIGLITAYGYYLTGTIAAPLVFQICCGVAGVLLETFYPSLITLVGFLF